MNKYDLIIHSLLILAIGLLAGYGLGFARAEINQFPDFEWIDNINPGVTTLQFTDVENGNLKGVMKGGPGRIAYQPDQIIEIGVNQAFNIPLSQINFPLIDLSEIIPEKAEFAASRQGKYYYSVLNPSILNLSEKNRIFFESADEAEKAGFERR